MGYIYSPLRGLIQDMAVVVVVVVVARTLTTRVFVPFLTPGLLVLTCTCVVMDNKG